MHDDRSRGAAQLLGNEPSSRGSQTSKRATPSLVVLWDECPWSPVRKRVFRSRAIAPPSNAANIEIPKSPSRGRSMAINKSRKGDRRDSTEEAQKSCGRFRPNSLGRAAHLDKNGCG